jgi:hypothetical protein
MNRTAGLCFAAALGLTTALGAQTTTTTPAQPGSTSADKANHDVTITGCLSKSANGGYMLTNARMETGSSSTATAAGSSTTTAGGAGATTTAGATGTTGESSAMPGTTWMLSGGSDLEKHLGHKIQVTGKTEWTGAAMEHGRSSTTSASGVGTTATTGTTAAGSSSDQPRLDVKSIKMVSASCP